MADLLKQSGSGGASPTSAWGTVATADVANSAVTYAKVQNVAAVSLLGNPTGSPAVASEIPLGNGLQFIVGALSVAATIGGGTVSSVSVISSHGFAGTVATNTTTPAITLSTTVTGVLKGDGTSISAATPGTDYLTSNQTITLTGDVTGSGTGSFAATVGKIGGNAIVLAGAFSTSGAHALILTITADTNVTLPTSGTLVSTTVTTLSSLVSIGTVTTGTWQATPVVPTYGGTGLATLTAHAVLVGAGTSNVAFATIGTAGRLLVDQGASADPAFASTGILLTQHHAAVATGTVSAGATTLDATTNDRWNVTLVNGTPTAITISGMVAGQTVRVAAIQDGTGSCTATWALNSGTLKWSGGSAPTLATGASKIDIIVFECTSAGVVCGNMAMPNC